ncbi:MAG: vitamin K epoxide reductase family protein [Candidatus Saccharibacteria bacterium]
MFSKFINFFTHRDQKIRSKRWIFIVILVTAVLGLLAAFVLSVDAVVLAKDSKAVLSCNINPIINCGAVANSPYSSMLGFPNSFLGMMVEPVFVIVAIAGLYGVKFPRQFMFGVQIAALFALIYAFFLFDISVNIIQALCPWCLLVDVVTIIMVAAITRYNIIDDNLYLSKKVSAKFKEFVVRDFDKFAAALLIVLGIATIIVKFGSGLFA